MACVPVDLYRQPESVEDCATQFRLCGRERFAEIRDAVENEASVLKVHGAVFAGGDFKIG